MVWCWFACRRRSSTAAWSPPETLRRLCSPLGGLNRWYPCRCSPYIRFGKALEKEVWEAPSSSPTLDLRADGVLPPSIGPFYLSSTSLPPAPLHCLLSLDTDSNAVEKEGDTHFTDGTLRTRAFTVFPRSAAPADRAGWPRVPVCRPECLLFNAAALHPVCI